MSMGVPILLAGKTKSAYAYSSIMIHSVSSFSFGKFSELEESVVEVKRLQTIIDNIIIENSLITLARLNEVHKQKLDWYIGTEECLTLGLIDSVL